MLTSSGYSRLDDHSNTTTTMVYDSSKQDNINLIGLLQSGKMINNCADKGEQAYLRQMMSPAGSVTHKPVETRVILTALKHDHMPASAPVDILTSPPPIVSSSTSGNNNHHHQLMNKGAFMFDNNAMSIEQTTTTTLPPVGTIINDRLISQARSNASIPSNVCDLAPGSYVSTTIVNDHHIDYYNHVDSTVGDDDDESNLSYLPYGYYYEDNKMLNQLISPLSLASTNSSSSPVFQSFPNAVGVNGASSSSASSASASLNQSFAANEACFENDKLGSQVLYNSDDQLAQYSDDLSYEFDLNGNIDCNNFIAQTHLFGGSNASKCGQQTPVAMNEMIFEFDDHKNIDGTYDCSNTGMGSVPFMMAAGKKIMSPVKSEPTLAQLNSTKEEDGWMLTSYDGAQASSTPVSMITTQQQQNTISSTSSPVLQIVPGGKWCAVSTSNALSRSPNLNPNVSSSDELIVMADVADDTSLEIQSILKLNQGQRHFVNGSVIASPPQISSSLQHTKLAQSSLAKPNFVSQNNIKKKTLLRELLSSETNNDELMLQRHDAAMQAGNTNLVLTNQMLGSSSALNTNKLQHKSLNCPTLQALITNTPGGEHANNLSPMLGSQAVAIGQFTALGCNIATLNTVLNNNNNRMRNHSMSTDYSASSHDEGFASQPDEESEESDGDNADNTSYNELMLLVNNDNIETEMFYPPQQQQAQLVTSTPTPLSVPIVNNTLNSQFVPDMRVINPSPTMKQEVFWNHQANHLKPGDALQYHAAASTSAASTSSMADDNEDQAMSSDDDDDDDESFYGDYDASDLLGATTSDDVNNKWSLNMGRSRKGSEKRYFWQYNVQSKGPKGPRLGSVSSIDQEEDPHVFKEISDPVFAPDCRVEGVKHSGKARRGDGNDLTPNPKKLLMIGLELKKLGKTINDLTPVTEVPVTCRNNKRKEKNKLASRACRLKKKAQHEANKIKLSGLGREHDRLVRIIEELRKLAQLNSIGQMPSIGKAVNEFVASHKPKIEVSGHTANFVNHILDNVSAGITNGGLDEF